MPYAFTLQQSQTIAPTKTISQEKKLVITTPKNCKGSIIRPLRIHSALQGQCLLRVPLSMHYAVSACYSLHTAYSKGAWSAYNTTYATMSIDSLVNWLIWLVFLIEYGKR